MSRKRAVVVYVTVFTAVLLTGSLSLTLAGTTSAGAGVLARIARPRVPDLPSPALPYGPATSGAIGCKFEAVKPYFLTKKGRKQYGEGRIKYCTDPPPDKCKMTVHLRSSTTGGVFWDNRQSRSTGWESCAKVKRRPVITPGDTCIAYPELVDWDTQVVLDIEITGEPIAAGSDTSKTVKNYCGP
jgi:hypothetical protein